MNPRFLREVSVETFKRRANKQFKMFPQTETETKKEKPYLKMWMRASPRDYWVLHYFNVFYAFLFKSLLRLENRKDHSKQISVRNTPTNLNRNIKEKPHLKIWRNASVNQGPMHTIAPPKSVIYIFMFVHVYGVFVKRAPCYANKQFKYTHKL